TGQDIGRKSLYFPPVQSFIPVFEGYLENSIQNGSSNCLLKPFCLRSGAAPIAVPPFHYAAEHSPASYTQSKIIKNLCKA
ncbi:MAG: hypothetical protein IJJ80_08240, partial [Clostridia bacterium]|nr:hypothetical protein [Clostridia bacterium]